MAGYALGFDDGGEVDSDDQAQAGAQAQTGIPEDESDGLDTSAPPKEKSGWQNNFDEAKRGTQQVGAAAKRVLSYLLGAGAAPPQVADQAAQQVKANDPQMSDDDANLMAVHEAATKGGPAAAWAMLQYNRTAYNAKQSFAQAALNGVDGKAGDLSAAAQAATQAGAHVLDGSSAVFTAAPEGVTATVRKPDGKNEQYRLTPQQFRDYLDTGKQGQWDRQMQDGISGSLAKVTGQVTGQASARDQGAGDDDESVTTPPSGQNMGSTPSTVDLSGGQQGLRGYKPMDYNALEDDNSSSQARGNQLFPSMSPEDTAGRRNYMINEENREALSKNKIDVAKAEGVNKRDVANIQAGARTQSADTRAQGEVAKQNIRTQGNKDVAHIQADARAKSEQAKALQQAQKMEQVSNDARMRERGRMARAEISNPNFLLQKPEDREAILNKYGLSGLGGQAPTGQAAAPPSGQAAAAPAGRPANVPEGAKLYKGKWYTRGANGEAVPVQ